MCTQVRSCNISSECSPGHVPGIFLPGANAMPYPTYSVSDWYDKDGNRVEISTAANRVDLGDHIDVSLEYGYDRFRLLIAGDMQIGTAMRASKPFGETPWIPPNTSQPSPAGLIKPLANWLKKMTVRK